MKIFKKWWLWLIVILLLGGFFLKTGISVVTEMELNCSKYNVNVCRCGGLIYDFGKECLGIRHSCEMYLDGCGGPPRPLSNEEMNQPNQNIQTGTNTENLEEDTKSSWYDLVDTYWAFTMSLPSELKLVEAGNNDGWKSEDEKSLFITIEGSDVLVDFSDPQSYGPLVEQFNTLDEFVEGDVILVDDMYVYNFITEYPEDQGPVLYRGMKEHFMLMKNGHAFQVLFLLDKNEDTGTQRVKNRQIFDTFKFFEPIASDLDNQISKYTQGVGLSVAKFEGRLTSEKALYPEYAYSHNIRNHDNPVVNYINTEYGQIVLYYKDKMSCSESVSVEGNLYGLKPKWDPDKNYIGYYMDVIDYQCPAGKDNNIGLNNADSDKIDSDQDGLSDVLEDTYGTDPNNPDTDGDSYLDGEEVENGYNPLGEGTLTLDKLNNGGVLSEEQAYSKARVSDLLNLGTIYYDDNLSYQGFCVSSEVNIIEDDLGVVNFSCISDNEAWAATVKLAENKYWCVNSSYQPKETDSPVNSAFCP